MDFKVVFSFAAILIFSATITVFAQQKEMALRNYSMKDGLPDEGVNAVIQDSHGFIWVGTYSGLSKFDGYHFTNYTNNSTSPNSLRSNYVNALLEDKSGHLWIGHSQGLDLFDPTSEKFNFHWPDSADGKTVFIVRKLIERRDGKIWVCSSEGVYVGDPKTFKIEKFPQVSVSVSDIDEMKDGSLVYGTGSGFYHVDAKTGKTTNYTHDSTNPKSLGDSTNTVWSVEVDRYDRVWVGMENGLDLFDPHDKSFLHYQSNSMIRAIQENFDETLLLGTQKGVLLFDPRKPHITERLTEGCIVSSVAKDTQGILWVSTLRGLRQLTPNNKKFHIYSQFGDGIGPIAEDKNNEIWLLGYRLYESVNTVFNFNPATGKIYSFQRHISDPRIFSFCQDKEKNIWFTTKSYLEKYSPEKQTSQVIHIKQAPEIDPITTFMDSKGMIWAGSWMGLGKYNPLTATGETLSSFPPALVYSILEDSSHNVWIGSTAGLSRYNLEKGTLDIFNKRSNDPQSLSGDIVYQLFMDKDNSIWLGTSGGLNKMIKGTENNIPRFINWQKSQTGLPNDDVYCILEEGDGTLWMTSGNMISHFDPAKNTFRNYDSKDGLSGSRFRGMGYLNGKGLRSHNGSIFFGSMDGLVRFHPDSLKDNDFKPPVVISDFLIRNQRVPILGTDADTLKWKTPLTQSISYTSEIRLTHDQNNFNFEFAALNFVNPEGNQYKYKLEPYEKEWVETSADNRFAHYTNISPGKYIFRVIASNNDGVWNEKGATLMIIISPPWWQTWWAYTLYGLAVMGMVLYWRNYENKRLKLMHRAEHLSELDKLKAHFFTNISHEFRTPVTLILGPLKDMYNKANDNEQKTVLATMLRNGQRLLRLINQLLDLSKLEAGKMTLLTAPVDLVAFIRELTALYESMAADKKIRYFFYSDLPDLIVYIDQEKTEKIIHNLISNAFKFTGADGEVIVNLKAEEKKWAIINVTDTGIGIPENQIDKIFDRFYQVDSSHTRRFEGSGLGMALVKELVTFHRGKIKVESKEGKGTVFTVCLPLGIAHLAQEEIIEPISTRERILFSEDMMSHEKNILVGKNKKPLVIPDSMPVVLIVEDNADMRHYICKTLWDQYRVIEASDGKQGLTIAEELVPELIISDVMMPEMDGYKLCELIKTKELTSHIPVILLTAKVDHESKITGLQTYADDFISKPFDSEELKLIVRNRLEARNRMKERFSREVTLEPKQIAITSFDERFIKKVLDVIEAHMDDENFSIEELSREVGYSSMHLYRKIKALAGQTPSQFLRTIRLKRAAELLSKDSDNVTQIAYRVGFNSVSYFNKCFKEQFGTTPGKFAELDTARENFSKHSN